MTDELSLSTLRPAEKRRSRKRVGRGMGSGKGRYSGRGVKGQKARAGSHKMRAGFEGGQMPVYMRLAKQRGSTSKDAMPVGPFRTRTQSVNVRDLERAFEAGAEVTPETLREKGLIKSTRVDVKILGDGDLAKKLAVTAHLFSKTAQVKIEAAGGTAVSLRTAEERKSRKARKLAAAKGGVPSAAREAEAEEEERDPEEPSPEETEGGE